MRAWRPLRVTSEISNNSDDHYKGLINNTVSKTPQHASTKDLVSDLIQRLG